MPVVGAVAGGVHEPRQQQYQLWNASTRRLPDNHTDENFLRDLVINANVTRRHYWQVVWESQYLLQQMCIALTVPATFLHLKSGVLSVQTLLYLNFGLLLMAAFMIIAVSCKATLLPALWKSVRQCFLLLTGLYNLSPLYQKLTLSISSDTIGASSVVLLILHLYLSNYSFKKSITETLSGAVSVGSAIAASVLLSSRLDTHYQVFSYLSFALGLFVLSPFFRKHLRQISGKAHLISTCFMLAITIGVAWKLSKTLAVAFGMLAVFTCCICPWLLISVEKHKVQISGPWDEAELVIYEAEKEA